MDTKDAPQVMSLADLLSHALMSDNNAVVARVRPENNDSEIVFVLQIIEITVDGVTESALIDDMPMPPKSQLN